MEDANDWDKLVDNSWNGTFLHTRRFLAYHGERFQDFSLVIEDGNRRVVGVFPAAIDPEMEARIVSHPGITYGGIVHDGALRGENMLDALHSICDIYRASGYHVIRYKTIPHIYHRVPASDDLYALFRLSARRYRCDLSATVDLANRPALAERRQRGLRKAQQGGVTIHEGTNYLEHFWPILEDNLISRHKVQPVHSLREIISLSSVFSRNIECIVGLANGQVIAGIILFQTHLVSHSQYSAANAEGRKMSAMDLATGHCLAKAQAARQRYFDFGVSTEHNGTFLNEGLYQFKTEFGAGGVAYEFYEIPL